MTKQLPEPTENRDNYGVMPLDKVGIGGGKIARVVFVCLFLAFGITAVTLYSMPRKFEARALLEVRGLGQSSKLSEPLVSDTVLGMVIQALGLGKRLKMAEGPALLTKVRGMIHTKHVRGTDLVELVVSDTDAERAAEMTQSILLAIRTVRGEEIYTQNERFLAILDGKLKEQEERLEKTRLNMEKALADFQAGGMGRKGGSAADGIAGEIGASGTSDEERSAPASLTQEVEGLREEMRAFDVLEAMNYVGCTQIRIRDPDVAKFMGQLAELEIAEKQADAHGLGLSHPHRKAIFVQMEGVKNLLPMAVTDARESSQRKFDQMQKQLENMRGSVDHGVEAGEQR